MARMGFASKWIELMMLCVSSASYSVLVNNQLVGPIVPKRGLRQGDPLSPYLFILCAEGLSSLILQAEKQGLVHGINICRRAPTISHLLFADDSVFFCRATSAECTTLKEVFRTYERASGQSINFSKSGVFYSRNVSLSQQMELSQILGITEELNTVKYLGLPSIIGKKKKEIFSYIKDRIWRKIQSWRGKTLSRAGREVLVKAVGQAIPSYCMQTFMLPTSLLDEIQRMLNSFWWGSKKPEGRGINWLRWESMCATKNSGGLGFRDLHAFNLALLGKQGWNLLSKPDAIVSQLFKARYYPRGNFLNAKLGHNPSFTWRSIWSSRFVLERGCRWKIGSGCDINVWHDPWLRDEMNFFISSPIATDLSWMRVNDLLIPGSRAWDVELLQELFNHRDIEEIQNIPLARNPLKDCIIWHFSKDGKYSVKSGYKVVMNACFTVNTEQAPGNWQKLWNLRTPPKVKSFAWRACKDCLPTRAKLQRRGITCPLSCVICDGEVENTWHIFITCTFATQCWSDANLSMIVNSCAEESEGFSDWFFKMLDVLDTDTTSTFVAILWSIWKQRNNKLWDDSLQRADQTVFAAKDLIRSWIAAKGNYPLSNQMNVSSSQISRWRKPPATYLKCNIDAAFFRNEKSMGFGTVLRDDRGNFVACRSSVMNAYYEVKEGEAVGLLEALSWIRDMGYKRVIFELDAKSVVDAMHNTKEDESEFGSIIRDCQLILYQEPSFSVSFISRFANAPAHKLAKDACSIYSPSIWFYPPSSIGAMLFADYNSCS